MDCRAESSSPSGSDHVHKSESQAQCEVGVDCTCEDDLGNVFTADDLIAVVSRLLTAARIVGMVWSQDPVLELLSPEQ